jgi:hypothetical protein
MTITQNTDGTFKITKGWTKKSIESFKFYNGRFFGLNSTDWVSEKPKSNDPAAAHFITIKRTPARNVYEKN